MALNNNTNNKNNNNSSNNNKNNNNNNMNNNNCNNNKTVTFGGVFHFPTLPKDDAKKMEADSKAVTIKNRFNCGSLRNSLKMVGSNGSTLIAIRLVRSKLRKREENLHTTNSPPAVTTATANHNNNNINNNNNNNIQPTEVVTTTTVTTAVAVTASENVPPPFLWQYHNGSTNTTVASSQYTLYNTDEDTLVHNLPCEEPRECKGFRKNLSGKWRRLVKKKQQQEVYTIPAELRDQLKQIYVY